MPNFEDVTKDFWARKPVWLVDLEALADDLEHEYLAPPKPDVWGRLDRMVVELREVREPFPAETVAGGRHLTLIQGGLSPIGDTGGDDVAC